MMRYMKIYIVMITMAICFASHSFGQEATTKQKEAAIRGVVLESSTKHPVAGASVTISGVASDITDDQGKFGLAKTCEGAILLIKSPGYADLKIPVQGKNEFTIYLHDENFKSSSQQVYLPFGVQDITTVTSAVSVLQNDNSYSSGNTSAQAAMQDGLPGLNSVIRSGAPGAAASIFLRGFNSLNATNQPLIVVDGVPFENSTISTSLITGNLVSPLSGIDPKDIESITVLKDATSIYGSKGANGVILINMAKAKTQSTKIDFYSNLNTNFSPSTKYKMLNAWQAKTYLGDALSTSGLTASEINALPYINEEVPVVENWGVDGNEDYYTYNHNTNWQDKIFQNSVGQNYGISVRGGDNVALYALSLGYLGNGGIVKNTDYSRYNTQFNTQINMSQKIKVNANINFSISDRNLAYEAESANFNPMYVSLVKAPFTTDYAYSVYGVKSNVYSDQDVFGVTNPTALLNDPTSIKSRNWRFFQNLEGDFVINKDVTISGLFGTTFDKIRENIFLPSLGLHHDTLSTAVVTNEMQASVARYSQYSFEGRLNYSHVFNKIHALNSRVGFRYQTNRSEWDWTKAYNSTGDDMTTVNEGDIDLTKNGGDIQNWKWLSYYINGDYALRNKYFLSFNMAMDASSRFGSDASGLNVMGSVFAFFPSLSGAWLISSENFMKSFSKINLLKLRLGYSLSGNDDIGNYSWGSYYNSQNFLSYSGFVRANISNPELQWETVGKLNAGLDMALFNDRLSFSIDAYRNKTNNLLVWKTASSSAGSMSYADNDGSIQNTGFEFGVNGRLIDHASFTWNAGLTVSHYKNKVCSMSEDETLTEIANGYVRTKVGKPIGQFYGYKTNGVYATSAAADADGLSIENTNGTYSSMSAGDVRFVNVDNSDKIIGESDMVVIGDPNPDVFGTISSDFRYRRIKLGLLFTYSYGNDIYNSLRRDLESMSNYNNQTQAVLNRWTYEGQVTNMPRATWGDPMGNSRFSDRWIEDGSYIRLKTITLSYDFAMKQKFLKELQVYVTGTNLVTLTKYLGYDPEFSMDANPLYYGIDTGQMPQPRSLTFGLKIGL